MLKSRLRSAAAGLLHRSGLLAMYRRTRLRDQALVLMYHRVFQPGEVPAGFERGMYVTTSSFEAQLAHLADAYEVVDLDTLLEWMEGRRQFNRPPCVLTFDDGWNDNYTNAFPLLKKYGLSGTIFLVTGQIGQHDMLTWDQVREMDAAGIRFASHTVTHRELTILTPDALEWELAASKAELARHIARPSPWFCYPKGYYHADAVRVAGRHYAGAVTTERRPVDKNARRHQVPRIGIHDDMASNTAMFAFRLAGLS